MARIVILQEIAENAQKIASSLSDHELLLFDGDAKAKSFLEANPADLIISAVHLSSCDVFEFLRWTKANTSTQNTPFILFCSEPSQIARYVSSDVRLAARALGARGYITMNSFEPTAFRAYIHGVLSMDFGNGDFIGSLPVTPITD